MFYSTFGYAQLTALINISCTAIVGAAGGRDGERRSEVEELGGGKDEGMDLKEGWEKMADFKKGVYFLGGYMVWMLAC